MKRLARLFAPRRIAVIGGGAWCAGIIGAADALGFSGEILPIHQTRDSVAGRAALRDLAEIDGAVDAAFIGVNRNATVGIVRALAARGAGGAVCFASGFSEAEAEAEGAAALEAELLAAAGDMPILGPNCYGFLNALDGAGIWPDQHGLRAVDRGVALLTQSSNIAINLTMQMRGLPIAMVVTCGNQAQLSQSDIALELLKDPRITALGVHIEGFGDLRKWEAVAAKAHARGVSVVVLKAGRSEAARAAAISHTASLAGGDAGADALMVRLGMARVRSLAGFLEALKIAHLGGRLERRTIASISCSGGEAALAADMAHGTGLAFPPLTERQTQDLRAVLGPKVALANPLDYHTYIWRDEAAMTRAWAAMATPGVALVIVVLDYPRTDRCDPADWDIATRAVIAAQAQTGARFAVCATLPELLPEATAAELMAAGVLALHGLETAMEALDAMGPLDETAPAPVLLPGPERAAKVLFEADAKEALAAHGVPVPEGVRTSPDKALAAANSLGGTLAVKVQGLAHKTGARGLALGVTAATLPDVLPTLARGPLLIERMVEGAVLELLVGVVRDPAHGFVLTLAAGGTRTELLSDRTSLLVPADRADIASALQKLRIAPLLSGFRGAPPVAKSAVLDAIEALQTYVVDNAATLEEIEINPLIVTETAAIAADALIRKAQ